MLKVRVAEDLVIVYLYVIVLKLRIYAANTVIDCFSEKLIVVLVSIYSALLLLKPGLTPVFNYKIKIIIALS